MALGRVKGGAEPRGGERGSATGNQGRFALAWIEISTGAFRVAETTADRLLADVFRVDPRELIVAEPVFYDPELKPVFDVLGRVANPQPPSLFDSASAAGRIARFFEVATPDRFPAPSYRQSQALSLMSKKRRRPSGRRCRGPSARSRVRRCSSIRRHAPIWSCCAPFPAAARARCSRRSTAR
jgi:hypothetical protein